MQFMEQEPIGITPDIIRPPKKITIGGQSIRTNDMAVYPTDNKPADVGGMLAIVRNAERVWINRQRQRNRPGAGRHMSNSKHA